MRIGLTDFHHDWGGQALQVWLLARALRDGGHEAVVFAPPGSTLAERAKGEGLPVEECCRFPRGFRPAAWWRDVRALREAVRRRGIEILHAHGSQDVWLAALCRRLGATYALVRTKHNSYPVRSHVANRWLYGSAVDRVITVAESIRQDLLRGGLARPERIITIHAGLDKTFGSDLPDDRERVRTEVRREFGLPVDAPLIGLVGRLAQDKGQETLLRALVAVRASVPAAQALLIGTGGDYDRQRALRSDLGLDDCAHYTLFRSDIARLTAACDAAVLAASACDASSTVVKEAMRLGVPVVATDVGGTREILDDGRCGEIVPPADPAALAQALTRTLLPADSEALAARVEAARERVRTHYLMPAVAEATLAVYREALKP